MSDPRGALAKLDALLDGAGEFVGELKDWSPVVRRFAEDALGPAIRQSGMLAGDVVGIVHTPFTWFRLKCLGAICRRAQELVGEADVNPLPTGYAVSLIDAMKDCDDETLQAMWARLLAAAVKSDERQQPMYSDTLRRLSPGDARAFDDFMRRYEQAKLGHPKVPNAPVVAQDEADAIARLLALALIESPFIGHGLGGGYRPTFYAELFYRIVRAAA